MARDSLTNRLVIGDAENVMPDTTNCNDNDDTTAGLASNIPL